MSPIQKRLLFWSPRILSIALAIFLSLFALDVFNEGLSPWQTLLSFAIHLLPTAFVVALLVVAWRWEWLGAVLFAAVAAWYAYTAWSRPHGFVPYLSLPALVVAALFLAGWLKRAQVHPTH